MTNLRNELKNRQLTSKINEKQKQNMETNRKIKSKQ